MIKENSKIIILIIIHFCAKLYCFLTNTSKRLQPRVSYLLSYWVGEGQTRRGASFLETLPGKELEKNGGYNVDPARYTKHYSPSLKYNFATSLII